MENILNHKQLDKKSVLYTGLSIRIEEITGLIK